MDRNEQGKISIPERFKADIERLSSLSPFGYEQVRKSFAKGLGIRASILDQMVKSYLPSNQIAVTLPYQQASQWHEAIQPQELLDDIAKTISRFIVCQNEAIVAATLWVAMTWFIDEIEIAPLAVITAPEKRCGKSQFLHLLSRMVKHPIPASNITPSALFRSIDRWQPTLLIDEADTFMRDNEELRGLINAGHTRESAFIIRSVGKDLVPTQFVVWGAKAIAGIGKLPDTIIDRAIVLKLRRKKADEKTDRIRHAEPDLFESIKSKLARLSQDYAGHIRKAKPDLPDTLNDRAQDNWEPLFAIAELAGETWLTQARNASLKLSGNHDQSASINVELLKDISDVIDTISSDRISSAELINRLCADQEKAWATFNHGSSISQRQLANRLREFGIVSNTIRLGTTTAKGYMFLDFVDAFNRYLQGYAL